MCPIKAPWMCLLFVWAALAHQASLPDLCHPTTKPELHINNGKGTGNTFSGPDGCLAFHFVASPSGMAADFTFAPFSVKPLQHYIVTFAVKTKNLKPMPRPAGGCVEIQTQGNPDKSRSCSAAYLTGGAYVSYRDGNGLADGWFPAYGSHAPSNSDWTNVTLEFSPPTTARTAILHLAFGAHDYAYAPNRMQGGLALGECWMGAVEIKELSEVKQMRNFCANPCMTVMAWI